MIRIPDVPSLQGQKINSAEGRAPEMSFGAANAPNAALGGAIASAFGGLGEHFQGVADQAQKMENARLESEARMRLDSDYAKLQIDLQSDNDPASRIERQKSFFEQSRGIAENPDLPPMVRDRMAAYHTEFTSKGMNRAAADAADLQQKRSHLQMSNELEQAVTSGNVETVNSVLGRAQESGLILPEQAVAARVRAEKEMKKQADQQVIVSDPKEWLETNPATTPAAGYDPIQWQNLQSFARGQLRQLTYEASSQIQDGIVSGQITKPEQIDELAGDLRPVAVEELKIALARRSADLVKNHFASPAYQQETVGSVFTMLADYDPDGEGFDSDFVRMDSLIRTLPPSAVRDELERNLKDVRSEKTREPKTHADAGDKALEAAKAAGLFGKVPEKEIMPTQRAINEGFLKDETKLSKWFSPEQIEKINEPAGKINEPAGKSKEPTNSSRQAAFRSLWAQRVNQDAGDPLLQNVAEAIVNGDSSVNQSGVEYDDAVISAKIQGEIRYGKARIEYAEWKTLNPSATDAEVEEKIRSLAGEGTRKKLSSGIYDSKPSRGESSLMGGFVPGETSMLLPDALAPNRASFIEEGQRYGIDPRLLAAISMHETGNGSSSAYRNKNNAMGVSNDSGPVAFADVKQSVAKMARLLGSKTSGPYKKARTIAEIASIYAPVGAGNDPRQLNGYWAEGVSKYYKQLGGNPLALIK